MRTIQSRRYSRFLFFRPTKAYLAAVSTASFAARCSLLLVWKKPFARASSFFRFARRTVPRLTLGICSSGGSERPRPPLSITGGFDKNPPPPSRTAQYFYRPHFLYFGRSPSL